MVAQILTERTIAQPQLAAPIEAQTAAIAPESLSIYISEATKEALAGAIPQLQAHLADCGGSYSAEQIQKALTLWLEQSIEQLAEDALWHLTDRSPCTVNQQGFDRALKRSAA